MFQTNRKASLLFIFLTVAIDSTGFGLVVPVFPEVIRRFVSDPSTVSRIYGYFIALWAILQMFASPLLGSLSDRFGRRPILLVSLFGGAIDYLFMAFAPTLPLLFIGRAISGVSGASWTVANAYVADISTDENRSKNFGFIGAAMGLGFITGPAIGGLLATHGAQVPFIAAGVVNLLNAIFGVFVLPESLSPGNRRELNVAALNPVASLAKILSMPAIAPLIFGYALMQFAGHTHLSIWALYTNHRYHWSTAEIGLSLAVVGVLSSISQGGLTQILVKALGEARVVILGSIGEGVCYWVLALATQGWVFYLGLFVSSIFWTSQPALQSLVSREVSPREQGELQGAMMSIVSLTAVLNPLIMTALYAATSNPNAKNLGILPGYLPGSPYMLGGVFLAAGGGVALRWKTKKDAEAYSKKASPVLDPIT